MFNRWNRKLVPSSWSILVLVLTSKQTYVVLQRILWVSSWRVNPLWRYIDSTPDERKNRMYFIKCFGSKDTCQTIYLFQDNLFFSTISHNVITKAQIYTFWFFLCWVIHQLCPTQNQVQKCTLSQTTNIISVIWKWFSMYWFLNQKYSL